MRQDIADQLLILDRARRAALARMDYSEARSIRLSIAIIIGLADYPGASEYQNATQNHSRPEGIFPSFG
jgi:hypothetical protein